MPAMDCDFNWSTLVLNKAIRFQMTTYAMKACMVSSYLFGFIIRICNSGNRDIF